MVSCFASLPGTAVLPLFTKGRCNNRQWLLQTRLLIKLVTAAVGRRVATLNWWLRADMLLLHHCTAVQLLLSSVPVLVLLSGFCAVCHALTWWLLPASYVGCLQYRQSMASTRRAELLASRAATVACALVPFAPILSVTSVTASEHLHLRLSITMIGC